MRKYLILYEKLINILIYCVVNRQNNKLLVDTIKARFYHL